MNGYAACPNCGPIQDTASMLSPVNWEWTPQRYTGGRRIRERTSAGIVAARAEGRVGGRRKKLDVAKRREIAESVITGRKSGADMARLYNVQSANRLTHRRPASDGSAIGAQAPTRGTGGTARVCLQEAAPESRVNVVTAEGRRGRRCVAGPPSNGELSGGNCRSRPR